MQDEVEETTLTQVKSFKYLGATITADGKSNTEVKSRDIQDKAAFPNQICLSSIPVIHMNVT
jgi:hypothetical protein